MSPPPPTPLLPSRLGEVSLLLGTEPIFDLGDDSWLAEEPDTPKASGSTLRPRQVSSPFRGTQLAIQTSRKPAIDDDVAFLEDMSLEEPILHGRGEKAQDEARRLDSPAVEMRRSSSRSTYSISSSRSGETTLCVSTLSIYSLVTQLFNNGDLIGMISSPGDSQARPPGPPPRSFTRRRIGLPDLRRLCQRLFIRPRWLIPLSAVKIWS